MGQKVHPIGFRLGVTVGDRHVKDWQGRWYADKDYTKFLHEDLNVRQTIMQRLADAGVSRVEIERSANQMTVTIHAAKPGIVIGKSGVKVEELRRNLETLTGKRVRVTIQEIRQPELDAYLVARSVADQLERRVAFRRAMKQAVGRAMRFGARGIRVQVSGRLGGAEMSRREWEREGRVPLHTLRADIDFGQAEAHTTYGVIGVKAWIYRGDVQPPTREEVFGPATRAGRTSPPPTMVAPGRTPPPAAGEGEGQTMGVGAPAEGAFGEKSSALGGTSPQVGPGADEAAADRAISGQAEAEPGGAEPDQAE
jgi:small subunit ribosomal protein S3